MAKMIKSMLSLAVVFALLGALVAAEAGEKKKVVMTISNQQNEFIVGMGESFKKIGAERGYDVQFLDANLDPTRQISQIETGVSQGAVAILVEPCSFDGLTIGLRAAKEAGIPVFTIHNAVSAGDLVTSAIRVDVKQGGYMKMEQCVKDVGENGEIAIMTGTLGMDTTNQICGGYEESLKKHPNIKVIFEGAGNWGAVDAAPLAENWVASGRKLDAVVCNNDGMALGVIPVLRTTGNIGKIKVYGLDATPEGLRAVKAGEMAATIFVDAHAEIVAAFDMIEAMQKGEKIPGEFVVPPVLVTKENVDEFMK
jgi:ribose transport system substrate-binding protein/inositol transport system substrate-binding protein